MQAGLQIDAKSLELFIKIWGMRGSAHSGEVQNAEALAEALLKKFGYTLADASSLFRDAEAQLTQLRAEQELRQQQAAKDKKEKEEAERRHSLWQKTCQPPAERANVIYRYGSLEKVLAWTDRERLLRAAVEQWSKFGEPPFPQTTASIDGCTTYFKNDYSDRVIRTISEAYPLPTTITEAKEEYTSWERRRRDLELVFECYDDYYLDMPVYLRHMIVAGLLEIELRANTVNEVLIRQRHYFGLESIRWEIDEAVLKDLEGLAGYEEMSVQNGHHASEQPGGHQSASERRQMVIEMLSNVDTQHLSDREISRRVGVSPQTVGNTRRRINAPAKAPA